jgi:hypothetical protein
MSEKKCSCGHTEKWHALNSAGQPYCTKDNYTGWNRCDIKLEEDKFSGLKFHIKSQDYFGTLATVLSLRRQTKQEIPESVIEDLMYLQRNYKIENK